MPKKRKGEAEVKRDIPLPKGKQTFGVIVELVGWAHARVRCFDGRTRICRVPGGLQRRIWIREGDLVLVDPWEYQFEKKGDIIYKYTLTEVEWLKRMGYLKELEDLEFE